RRGPCSTECSADADRSHLVVRVYQWLAQGPAHARCGHPTLRYVPIAFRARRVHHRRYHRDAAARRAAPPQNPDDTEEPMTHDIARGLRLSRLVLLLSAAGATSLKAQDPRDSLV